jgi:hypothetical protein
VPVKTFGSKNTITGDCSKLHCGALHNLCSSINIIGVIK